MEQKFPVESDFGKYFLYNLYLRTISASKSEEKINLENSNKFNQCLNLNRNVLRGLNCAESKKAVENYFTVNADKFSDFKKKIGTTCNSQISGFLSNYYYLQSRYADSSLYERVSSETLLEEKFREIKNCLGFEESFILSP